MRESDWTRAAVLKPCNSRGTRLQKETKTVKYNGRGRQLQLLILLHHARTCQYTGHQFQVVKVFAAEILGKAGIQAFP